MRAAFLNIAGAGFIAMAGGSMYAVLQLAADGDYKTAIAGFFFSVLGNGALGALCWHVALREEK